MHNPKDEKDGDAADAGRLSESNSYFQRSFSNTGNYLVQDNEIVSVTFTRIKRIVRGRLIGKYAVILTKS